MHFFSFDRGIVVGFCFALWIGAAGLVCWALVPKQMPDEPVMTFTASPAVVVRAGSLNGSSPGQAMQLSMAQR